mgnify:FL=1
MGWKSKKDGTHFNTDKTVRSSEPSVEVNLEIDNNSDDFSEGVRKDFEENKESQMTFKEFVNSGRYLEDEVRKRAEKHGSHFFDADSMRFFSSRVSELMWSEGDMKNYENESIYFITSEADRGHIQHSGSVRAYTVRKIDRDGDIDTIGEFQGYETLNDARHAIMDLI